MPVRYTARAIRIIILVVTISYLGLMAFAALFANRMVFPAPPSSYGEDLPGIIRFPYDETGRAVSMIYLPREGARFLVFYHHGNGEDLQQLLPRLQSLQQRGFAVLAWDYPGYGTSDGSSTEKLVNDTAEKIWQAIPSRFHYDPQNIILYGRSLGGGPAIELASRHQPAGLILEATFTSAFRVGLGARILPWDIFDNLARIGRINCPVLFLQGTEDRTVPFSHGRALYDSAPEPKAFRWFEGGGQNDLIETYPEIYYTSIREFIESIPVQEKGIQ